MKARKFHLIIVLSIAIATLASAKVHTFTGEVSDAMCGAKHMIADKAECTRDCVNKGSNYALLVGDKVYTLHTTDKSALSELNTLAGQQAKVTGTADGDTIEVSKVAAAK
jgi:hypothetical protein